MSMRLIWISRLRRQLNKHGSRRMAVLGDHVETLSSHKEISECKAGLLLSLLSGSKFLLTKG